MKLHPRTTGLTLRNAIRVFARAPSARILTGFAVYAIVYRASLGEFSHWDAALVALQLLLHPMLEWLIHVFVLHQRPRTLGPFVFDTLLAREHREHHRDPHDPRWWWIPTRSGVLLFVGLVVVAHVVAPAPLAATFLLTTTFTALVYEWTHFLCHSTYKPRSRYVKRLARLHRLHHFKNERYWLGVTAHAADRLLRTMAEPGDVETSPSCRTLER